MTLHKNYIAILISIIIVVGLFFLYYIEKNSSSNNTTSTTTVETLVPKPTAGKPSTKPSSSNTSTKPPSPTVATKGFHSYTNAEYNFSIKYPPTTQIRNGFSTFHELGNNWRLYAGQANQGKGILELSPFTIDQGSISNGKQQYPLYFTALVRIGVSPNTAECYSSDAGYTNQKITNVTINGVAFKKFSTQDAGMMKYTQAESYRTIRNNKCFVIEQIKNGSSYRDEKMAPGIADTALNEYYKAAETIVKTFTFTR